MLIKFIVANLRSNLPSLRLLQSKRREIASSLVYYKRLTKHRLRHFINTKTLLAMTNPSEISSSQQRELEISGWLMFPFKNIK